MSKVLYIAEGEIEERFIKFLTQNNFIQMGRFKKFNLTQNRLKDSDSPLTTKIDKAICILDTDVISATIFSNLIFNLKKLKEICSNCVIILIQYKNFEDELRFVLNNDNLTKLFHLPNTTKDLKKFLAQSVNYEKYIVKENLCRYCTRPDSFKEELKKYGKNFSKIHIESIEKCMI